jgi:hypothetical protein
MSGFFWRFVEREGVAFLETAELKRFRFSSRKTPSCLSFILAHEGIETDCGAWSSGLEAKDSEPVKIISISCDRRRPASAGFSKLLQTWSANSEP